MDKCPSWRELGVQIRVGSAFQPSDGSTPPNYPSDPLSLVIKANRTQRAHGLPYAIRDRLSNRTEKQDVFKADQGVKF
jgi:hypothetical protein